MRLNSKAIDFDLVSKYAAALSGGDRMPGELLTYSQSEYFLGSGTSKKAIKPGFELVVNMPNLMFAWRKWEDGRPNTPHMCYPLVGETLPPRAEMGDDDKEQWELMKKDGKLVKNDDGQTIPLDPWQTVAILMARDDKGNLLRFECSNVSSKMAVAALVTEYAEQGKRHPDELPLVVFGDQKLKRKGSTDKYFAPLFEIVGWEKATKEDFPEGGVALSSGDEEPAPKAGTGKAQTRALPKPEVEEEDEKPARTARRARVEEEEDEEDDVRPARSRRKSLIAA
jgi:hypothetical protein